MSDDPMQMSADEYLRSTFFASDAEMDALKQAAADRKARLAERREKREEIAALRAIVRGFNTLQDLGPHHVKAALNYIVDRYRADQQKGTV